MKNNFIRLFVFAGILFLPSSCNTQTHNESSVKIDRQPSVAGSFYPSDKNELSKMLEGFFEKAPNVLTQQPLALIVPHAGYVFSGAVAAAAYKQIDPDRIFKHVFLIGASHTMFFDGVSVYSQGDFITPLGKVTVDTLSAFLDTQYKFIINDPGPHIKEHSLEVQLPFLQYWLKNKFSIVPIIIGGESQETCRKLASALEPYFNEENLFVISTDFSHYPTYEDAKLSDKAMSNAVLTNSSGKFLKAKAEDENRNIPNLVTAMCGWTSVLSLLYITEKQNDVTYKEIIYKNSGDSDYGDKEKVVGYTAICAVGTKIAQDKITFQLTDEDKMELLRIARNAIHCRLEGKTLSDINEKTFSEDLLITTGAFVTLKENGELRGCIGNFQPNEPLYKVIQSMAIASATEDYRFAPLKLTEIPIVEIEISVLTPLQKIKSIDEIVMGRHGIYIRQGNRSGTFLPQVATETGWSKEEFLGHCAQDKAFIGYNGWKNADIYIYEAFVFSEDEFKDKLKSR
jgi:AmmeMemoRadiSam system protein B/AmmeMemoRadiSam system protein A